MSEDVTPRLDLLIGGDAAAAAWLYDTFAAGIFRRLRWRYPRLEPEDLLHDLFITVFKDDCRLLRELKERSPGPIAPSDLERRLWDLACGLATNRQRSHGHSRTLPLAETFDGPDTRPSAERSAVDKDRLERLAECVERTNARVFLYFTLRFRDGLAPEEIAGVTGWSKKATYKLKQRL
ncbi:MAG: hypothetical protein AAFX50_20080, partial [Acidobacteriota bacterium]